MTFRKLPIALAAATLTIAPIAVQAAPIERAAAPTAEESEMRGSLLWILLAIAAGVALFLVLDKNNDPVSP